MHVGLHISLCTLYHFSAQYITLFAYYMFHFLITCIIIQTGLGDPSSDVPSSSTSVMVLTGSAQCIFASMFRHSDVCLRHQISWLKGLNQCIKCPVFPSRCLPPSSNLGDERVKIMHDLSISLFCHQMTVSQANCVNATCLYSDCGIAYIFFKTFPQSWLNAPNV